MSGISSPSTLLTVNSQSTSLNIYSAIKIGLGVATFFAPAFVNSTLLNKAAAKVNVEGPGEGTTIATSVGARFVAARDVVIGLLLRDSTAAVVLRGLQVSALTDALDIASVAIGFLEGRLDSQLALFLGGVSAVSLAFQGYLLSN